MKEYAFRSVLVLDGSIYPEIYKPADEWRALLGGVPADVVHLPSGELVPDLAPYTHVIVTGSEASINRPEPWFDVEADAVRRAFEQSKPMLGSCFGHQMLAQALSGRQYTVVSPAPEVGWIEVEIVEEDELLDGLNNPLHMFASHFDEVMSPPAPWKVLARSKGCAVQVMRYADRPIWGIQAHPEIPPGAQAPSPTIGKRPGIFLSMRKAISRSAPTVRPIRKHASTVIPSAVSGLTSNSRRPFPSQGR